MLTLKNSDDYQAVYTEDEKVELLFDCPVCGEQDCLLPDCKPVWDLTQIVLRSFLCEKCDRLIFVISEDLGV